VGQAANTIEIDVDEAEFALGGHATLQIATLGFGVDYFTRCS